MSLNLQKPIYTEKTKCQDCYKCIRECPVKAIRVENSHAIIISESCVLCGHCVKVCPSDAKKIRDDVSKTKQLLKLKEKVILSLAPAFVSEFTDVTPSQIISAAKKLGFYGVSETAIGADLVSSRLAEELEKNNESDKKLFLSSACPVVVEYIKIYMPQLADYITDKASPLMVHAGFLKKQYGNDIGVVFAGPCIGKKRESDTWHTIDSVIGFDELKKWFKDAGIDLKSEPKEESFIPFRAAKGALYPIDGGMISAIKKYKEFSKAKMFSITGLPEIKESLEGFDPETIKSPLFLELLACPGGCINGPLANSGGAIAKRHINLLDYAESAQDTTKEEVPGDISGTLPVSEYKAIFYGEEEILHALHQVGKFSGEDELNCGGCGYDTCRCFAAAMLDRKAEKTMCVSYMRRLAQNKASGIMRAIPSGVVICDSDLNIVECNINFARLMGEDTLAIFEAKPGMEGAQLDKITEMAKFFSDVMEKDGPDVVEHNFREKKKIFHITIFSIEKGHTACGVIQDVTEPQVRKDIVIQQTRDVIDKNLEVVQKIAFLLGENAAETEATLNSLADSFSDYGDDDDE